MAMFVRKCEWMHIETAHQFDVISATFTKLQYYLGMKLRFSHSVVGNYIISMNTLGFSEGLVLQFRLHQVNVLVYESLCSFQNKIILTAISLYSEDVLYQLWRRKVLQEVNPCIFITAFHDLSFCPLTHFHYYINSSRNIKH